MKPKDTEDYYIVDDLTESDGVIFPDDYMEKLKGTPYFTWMTIMSKQVQNKEFNKLPVSEIYSYFDEMIEEQEDYLDPIKTRDEGLEIITSLCEEGYIEKLYYDENGQIEFIGTLTNLYGYKLKDPENYRENYQAPTFTLVDDE